MNRDICTTKIIYFSQLLDRCFNLLNERNPNLNVKKKYIIPEPTIHRVGTRRTCWANFPRTCEMFEILASLCDKKN